MSIGSRTHEEFMEEARAFHGYPAPGLIIGGYMVELAKRHMPEGVLYDAVSETAHCLPDAVQRLRRARSATAGFASCPSAFTR